MISKIALLYASAQAIKISGVEETCTSNIDRMGTQDEAYTSRVGKAGAWNDPKFPADTSSLFWKSDPESLKTSMQKSVSGWKTPREIEGKTPSLWGSKGVQAAGIN